MKQILVVGLGNPGTKFDGTRHNLGIEVVRDWVDSLGLQQDWKMNDSVQSEIIEFSLDDAVKVTALFPTTFMNDSGRAVAAFLKNTPLTPQDVVVVHDDIELELGDISFDRHGGSAKGHNGVRSIQDALQTNDIPRLRLGVGRPLDGMEVNAFVLHSFSPSEREQLTVLRQQAIEHLTKVVRD